MTFGFEISEEVPDDTACCDPGRSGASSRRVVEPA
jgi:hypothetical protein